VNDAAAVSAVLVADSVSEHAAVVGPAAR